MDICYDGDKYTALPYREKMPRIESILQGEGC